MNRIAELLGTGDIFLNVKAASKALLFDEIGRLMTHGHALSPAWVSESLWRREQSGSTGLGDGVAIPHARVKNLDRVLAAYLRLVSPIPFAAPDGRPVSDVLVLLVPKQATDEHLKILSEATQMFSNRLFREHLQRCMQAQEVRCLFESWNLATPELTVLSY